MKTADGLVESTMFKTNGLSGHAANQLSSRVEARSEADDDESIAKYLFKLSRDVILSLDRIGNILCINERGVELSGYSESELRERKSFRTSASSRGLEGCT